MVTVNTLLDTVQGGLAGNTEGLKALDALRQQITDYHQFYEIMTRSATYFNYYLQIEMKIITTTNDTTTTEMLKEQRREYIELLGRLSHYDSARDE